MIVIKNFINNKFYLIDTIDYNNDFIITNFQNILQQKIMQLKPFINNEKNPDIISYYHEMENKNIEFENNSLEWNIIKTLKK